MAGYVPSALVTQVAMTATPGTSIFTGSGGTTYILRTIHFDTAASSKTVTLSLKADAAGTRLFDAYALTINVPAIFNGWWVVAGAGAHDIDASVNSTAASVGVYGYSFT
jgi:hypothetical protein